MHNFVHQLYYPIEDQLKADFMSRLRWVKMLKYKYQQNNQSHVSMKLSIIHISTKQLVTCINEIINHTDINKTISHMYQQNNQSQMPAK
jgi:hypothetical protein